MTIVHPTNLTATLDTAAETFFYQIPIPKSAREEISLMLISRQVQTGVNAGFFIPYTAETGAQPRLFSGEQLRTSFAQSHLQLIESARILNLLDLDNPAVAQSIRSAIQRIETMCYSQFCAKGECKVLTIAFLRLLASDGMGESGPRISTLLTHLARYRDAKGKWGGFPFYFTLLALTELDVPQAIQELQYSVSICEKKQAQNWPADPISKRRQAIIGKVLARS